GGRSRATLRCERPPRLRRCSGFAEIFLMPQPPLLTRRGIGSNFHNMISIPRSTSAPTREPGAVPHRNIFVTSASPHLHVAALPIVVSIPIHIDPSSLRSSRVSGSQRQLLLLPEGRSQGHGAYLHRKTDPPYLPRHRSQ